MKEILNPQEFYKKMKEIQKEYEYDEETRHIKMDDLMGNLLEALGYERGVRVFEETNKWYA